MLSLEDLRDIKLGLQTEKLQLERENYSEIIAERQDMNKKRMDEIDATVKCIDTMLVDSVH